MAEDPGPDPEPERPLHTVLLFRTAGGFGAFEVADGRSAFVLAGLLANASPPGWHDATEWLCVQVSEVREAQWPKAWD